MWEGEAPEWEPDDPTILIAADDQGDAVTPRHLKSRQTELAERYTIHVVCAWLGNALANEHSLQGTKAHYEKAAQSTVERGC